MTETRYTFRKKERLSSIKLINSLFEDGKALFSYPFKIYYNTNPDGINRILISVPKRQHKKAVNRNLVRRRIRESYRLNREILESVPGLDFAVVYISSEILDYNQINTALKNALSKLKKHSDTDSIGTTNSAD